VRDLDASAGWYSQVLGANEAFRGANEAHGFAVAYLFEPASNMILGLVQHSETEAEPYSERRAGLDHLSFAVADRAALEEWKVRLDELGIENGGVEDQAFGAGLTFRDPDGIALEFYHLVMPAAPK
jgi:catechol-2,3-dioxygenase